MLEPKNVPINVEVQLSGPEPILKGERRIPVCQPTLTGNEKKYVNDCMESGWVSSLGPYVERFQKMFAEKVGCKYAIACSNGTTALHLALAVLGIKQGDEVIVPSFTMIATANAVSYLGAKPVFVDAEPITYNINPLLIEEKITPRTKAIIAVHIYGHPCDMNMIKDIATRYNLYVIEDAAEAHGAEYYGEKVGSLGDIASFSLYANKIITCGEGGVVTTNNKDLAELCYTLRDFAFSKERHFWHKYLGYNFRMPNISAAISLAQTEQLEKFVKCRIRNAKLYSERLSGVPGIRTPIELNNCKNVYWMYAITLDRDLYDRDYVRNKLANVGVETRTFFIPLHLQPIYYNGEEGCYPISEMLMKEGLYLPSSSHLTEEEIDYICSHLRRILC